MNTNINLDIDKKRNNEIKCEILKKMNKLSLDGSINSDDFSHNMNYHVEGKNDNDIDENSFTSSLIQSKSNEKIQKKRNIIKKISKKKYIKYPRSITLEYEGIYTKDDDIQQVGDNFSDDNYIVARYEKKWFKIKISS